MSSEIWLKEIEAIAARANAWLNFSIICGWIGFGLAVTAGIILFVRWKHGKN